MSQDPLGPTYDVIVVGSGATGGWAAKRLSEAGLKVALLEAGRAISPKEFTEHMPAYKLKYRDHSPEIVQHAPIQKQCYACMEYNYEWFVNDLENPYSTLPESRSLWQRLRVVRRAIAGVGSPELSHERLRLKGRPAATATATTGPFSTPTLRPTTTSSSNTWASPAPPKVTKCCPTANFCRR